MSGAHSDVGPELRKLAQAFLDGIDPAVRTAAAKAAGTGPGTGKCQQVWCPVCALAALVTGDEHPLLTIVADHSVALLGVLRSIIDDIDNVDTSAPPPGGPSGDGQPSRAAGAPEDGVARNRYQAIPVTVEE